MANDAAVLGAGQLPKVNRRTLLKAASAALFILRSAQGLPNVLLINTDDQRFDTIAALGKPAVVAELRELYARWNRSNVNPLWTDEHAENVRKERESVLGSGRRALPLRK